MADESEAGPDQDRLREDARLLREQEAGLPDPDEPQPVEDTTVALAAMLPPAHGLLREICLSTADPADSDEVEGRVDAGEYIRAAAEATKGDEVTDALEGMALRGLSETVRAGGLSYIKAPAGQAVDPQPVDGAPADVSLKTETSPEESLLTTARRARRLGGWWRVVQLVLLASFGTLVALGLFADKWVGTWADVAVVLAWGATLNVTAEAITAAAGKLPGMP
jgi:hypothetical protein